MPRRPGRPRSEQARIAILKSAHELLLKKGVAGLTVEAVATRAGVGKPTIYRYWANAKELAMAATMAQIEEAQPDMAASTSPAEALRGLLQELVKQFSASHGRQTVMLLATAYSDSELSKAFRNQVIMRSREQGRQYIEAAKEAGEIKSDKSTDVLLDLLFGAVFFRLLIGHQPLSSEFTDQAVSSILHS